MRQEARQAFAHDAEVVMTSAGNIGAPGAAITVALCGHWDHEPPCPLAPHHSRAARDGDTVHVRTLFAVEPSRADTVRHRIDEALRAGQLSGPDGVTTQWELRRSEAADVSAQEAAHAQRLTQG
jgi:hypothetical protein